MDWIQFLQIICVPVFRCFFYKLGEQRKEIKLFERDLNEFKISVALRNIPLRLTSIAKAVAILYILGYRRGKEKEQVKVMKGAVFL